MKNSSDINPFFIHLFTDYILEQELTTVVYREFKNKIHLTDKMKMDKEDIRLRRKDVPQSHVSNRPDSQITRVAGLNK